MFFLSKILYLVPFKIRYQLIFLFLSFLIGIFLEVFSIGLILPVISALLSKESKIFEFDLLAIFQNLSNRLEIDLIIIVLSLLFLIFFIKAIFLFYLLWFQQSFNEKISNIMSSKLFEKYMNAEYFVHLEKNSSELIRNVSAEIQIFNKQVIIPILYLFMDVMIFFGIFIIVLSVEAQGTIYLFLIYALFGILYILLFKKKLLEFGILRQLHDGKRIKSSINAFHGIKTIKIFNKEIEFLKNFMTHTMALNKIGKLTGFILQIPKQVIELITVASFIFLIIFLSKNNTNIIDIIPKLALFAACAFRLIPCINRLMFNYQLLKVGIPSVTKLFEEHKILERNTAYKNLEKNISFIEKIEFKNINFSFNNNKKIFNNLNLVINKGESVGIIGKTGEGKTTFLDIFLGLLDPTSGEINIDETNLKECKRQWQQLIGYVPQSTFLLDDTIKNNITLKFDNENFDNDKFENSIHNSQVSEFSKKLDTGVDTIIGDRGVKISGGQQQRIGIARALYKNPAVLILDESTSSLDAETEEKIINDVLKLEKTKTLIIVSHRGSTIQKCKHIYELKDNKFKKIK